MSIYTNSIDCPYPQVAYSEIHDATTSERCQSFFANPFESAVEEALPSLAGCLERAKTAYGVREADFLRDHHALAYASPTLKFWMKYPS